MIDLIKWQLRCYTDLKHIYFKDLDEAKRYAEEHIQSCPQGAMPWAEDIAWHITELGYLVSAANGGFLDHALIPTRLSWDVDADYAAGRSKRFNSADEFLAHLDSLSQPQ